MKPALFLLLFWATVFLVFCAYLIALGHVCVAAWFGTIAMAFALSAVFKAEADE